MTWLIPGRMVNGGGLDYAEFVWCFRRCHRSRLARYLAWPPTTVTVSVGEPEDDWYCCSHHMVETPSHPWAAVTCGECLHTFADRRDVQRVWEVEIGEWRRFEDIPACPVCDHDW